MITGRGKRRDTEQILLARLSILRYINFINRCSLHAFRLAETASESDGTIHIRPIFSKDVLQNAASVYGVRQGRFRPLRFTIQKKIEKGGEALWEKKMTLSVPTWRRRISLQTS